MIEHSSGFKKSLTKVLDDEARRLTDIHPKFHRHRHPDHPLAYQVALEHIQQQIQELRQRCTDLSDTEFERTYHSIVGKLDAAISPELDYQRVSKRFLRGAPSRVLDKDRTIEAGAGKFVEEIPDLKTFLEQFPVFFIPRKVEVAQMVAAAVQLHRQREEKGECPKNSPIQILDIGGGAGALGKLMLDVAKENGLEMLYTVVDPYKPTVSVATEHYRDDHQLRFVASGGEDVVANYYKGSNSLIPQLLEEREKLINKASDLEPLLVEIVDRVGRRDKDGELTTMQDFLDIMKDEFGIDLINLDPPFTPGEYAHRYKDASDEPASLEYWKMAELKNYLKREHFPSVESRTNEFAMYCKELIRKNVNTKDYEIEEAMVSVLTAFDLVINSWMPPQIDLSPAVRQANGAGILYAMERFGATGCQPVSQAKYGDQPNRTQDGVSYTPGPAYSTRAGWISHSTPQAQKMLKFGHYSDLTQRSEIEVDGLFGPSHIDVEPFENAFLMQVKEGFVGGVDLFSPESSGIRVEGEYPWESELRERGGDVAPVIPIKDRDGVPQYREPMHSQSISIAAAFNGKK